jgi:peroxiredoxin family protein
MPVPAPPAAEAEPLTLIVFSGDFARVHYALVLAASALALGRPATLFFAGPAVAALVRSDAGGAPGWHRLAGHAANDDYAARGIGDFATLFDSCVELGARLSVCEMALRVAGLAPADLRDDVAITVAGAVGLLAAAPATGTLVFV